MKKKSFFGKIILSVLCVIAFLVLATASDNKDGQSSGDYDSDPNTPTYIDDNSSDYSSDISEDSRAEDEEYYSSGAED